MTPDHACDQTSVFGRIDEAAIGEAQRLAGCSQGIRSRFGFEFSFFGCTARAHFAVGQIDDSEWNFTIAQEKRNPAHSPLHVVGMRSEEQNVYRHRFHSGALDGGTMPFSLK